MVMNALKNIPGLDSWDGIRTKEYEESLWLIDNLFPVGSDVFIWGKQGVGKTPLVWWTSVAMTPTMDDFFGRKTVNGRTLIIELDMPERLTNERLRYFPQLSGREDIYILHHKPISIVNGQVEPKVAEKLAQIREHFDPDCVQFDTLRKAHNMKDTDSDAPSAVYGAYRRIFDRSCNVYWHHERKEGRGQDMQGPPEESFSGSKAWINDPQLAAHVRIHHGVNIRHPHGLTVWKNQAGPSGKETEWRYKLVDGWKIEAMSMEHESVLALSQAMSGNQLADAVSKMLKVSKSTAWRRIREAKELSEQSSAEEIFTGKEASK